MLLRFKIKLLLFLLLYVFQLEYRISNDTNYDTYRGEGDTVYYYYFIREQKFQIIRDKKRVVLCLLLIAYFLSKFSHYNRLLLLVYIIRT